MILIGRNLSPFVRRTAISLKLIGLEFEQRPLSTADHADEIAKYNPLGRVPALVLDDGEALIDSTAIIDYLNEIAPAERRLIPPAGAERRAVLRADAIGLGATEKAIQAVYEKNRRPADKIYQGWLDMLSGQVTGGLIALDNELGSKAWLVGDRLTLADVTAVCAFGVAPACLDNPAADARFANLAGLAGRCHELPAFAETVHRPD